MPIVFNGTTVEKVLFNSVELDNVKFNGTTVFTTWVPETWVFNSTLDFSSIQKSKVTWTCNFRYQYVTGRYEAVNQLVLTFLTRWTMTYYKNGLPYETAYKSDTGWTNSFVRTIILDEQPPSAMYEFIQANAIKQ